MDKPVPTFSQRLHKFWRTLKAKLHRYKVHSLKRFTRWIDPKLSQYRTPESKQLTPSQMPQITDRGTTAKKFTSATEPLTPNSKTELLNLLKATSHEVLSNHEREIITNVMQFGDRHVSDLMAPKSAIVYVKQDEVLGPLTLDRLYRSGFQDFPVLSAQHNIIGVIHTTALNSLEVRETNRASDLLDPKICYVREDYTLYQALAAFIRTNSYIFLVIDRFERIVGLLTYQMIVDYLLGEIPTDNFEQDSNRLAVAKRKN